MTQRERFNVLFVAILESLKSSILVHANETSIARSCVNCKPNLDMDIQNSNATREGKKLHQHIQNLVQTSPNIRAAESVFHHAGTHSNAHCCMQTVPCSNKQIP